MNLAALRAQFRSEADDSAAPYLFADAELNDWLNQAVEEAAIRADLLLEVDDAAVCQINVASGTAGYPLHAKITRVSHAEFLADGEDATSSTRLELIDRVKLDRVRPCWRQETERPRFLLTENGTARLAPNPDENGTVTLEAYRLPMTTMAADDDTPEIREQHHRYLVDWALFRAYSKPDTETQDLARAQAAQARFEDHFGPRPDADMKQSDERQPHANAAFYW